MKAGKALYKRLLPDRARGTTTVICHWCSLNSPFKASTPISAQRTGSGAMMLAVIAGSFNKSSLTQTRPPSRLGGRFALPITPPHETTWLERQSMRSRHAIAVRQPMRVRRSAGGHCVSRRVKLDRRVDSRGTSPITTPKGAALRRASTACISPRGP